MSLIRLILAKAFLQTRGRWEDVDAVEGSVL